jgi:hypothetical protein
MCLTGEFSSASSDLLSGAPPAAWSALGNFLGDASFATSAKAKEGQYCEDHNDKPNNVNNGVHGSPLMQKFAKS